MRIQKCWAATVPAAVLVISALTGCGHGNSVPATFVDSSQSLRGSISTSSTLFVGKAPLYKAVPLNGFIPTFVMEDGQLVGFYGPQAAVFRNGNVTVLMSSGCLGAEAFSANAAHEAVGVCVADQPTAMYWANGVPKQLATPPPFRGNPNYYAAAQVIDDGGEILGQGGPQSSHGYLTRYFKSGKPAEIFGPQGDLGNINAFGAYLFTAYPSGEAYIGHGDRLEKLLPQFSDRKQAATWIDDAGTVTGWVNFGNPKAPVHRAFIRTRTAMTFIDPPTTGESLEPAGVNRTNEVIGTAGNDMFRYLSGNLITNLSQYIEPAGEYCCPVPGLSDDGSFAAFDPNADQFYLMVPINN